ncbi:MAG: 1-deoxy-D-xylulose-5-phosphate synthase [Armatimonadetes bacterium]|nr:1-deoxy-D-xylulose-5-phosphate synthase [Armatimonadota bacterium]
MHDKLLDRLDLPRDLRKLSMADTRRLAREIRDLIVDVVSNNGGHLAPSLGVVELSIAMLAVMDVPKDKIIWDVGHQCYAYKILTGRREAFHTLRQAGGISGFPKPGESQCDAFATGHASTSISAALGIAQGRDLAGENYAVTAVIGDGALGGGMAWEAINNAGASRANLLVILNDNRMSISISIGALAAHIARLRTMPFYRSVENGAESFFKRMPLGGGLIRKTAQALKRSLTSWISPTSGTIFEALGFEYLGPIDGHDVAQLKHFITQARSIKGPVLLHVVTTKGKGYHRAENNARQYHGVAPFNSSNGKASSNGGRTYTDVFGKTLCELARRDPKIVAITAAMPDGTGLNRFARKFPTRFFNVGIAEEHAVTFAAGLASAGAKPVVAIYSTFLQRAYDQIIHDVCLQNLPVVFMLDRAGIVGEDGPTHHGIFDLSYLRHIPNLTVMAPRDASELSDMLFTAVKMDSPVAIRYPRGEAVGKRRAPIKELPVAKSELLRNGTDAAIIAIGTAANSALDAAIELEKLGVQVRVINARFVKPLDEAAIISAASECDALVLVEENTIQGGFASAVLECLARNRLLKQNLEIVALPDSFISHGRASDIRSQYGLNAKGIVDAVSRAITGKEPIESGDNIVIHQSI